jgi:hypothetical protein
MDSVTTVASTTFNDFLFKNATTMSPLLGVSPLAGVFPLAEALFFPCQVDNITGNVLAATETLLSPSARAVGSSARDVG